MQVENFERGGTEYMLERWSELSSKVEQKVEYHNRVINLNEKSIEWKSEHELSLYPKQQIELLLQSSGFSDYTFYDGLTKEPLIDNSNKMSVVAEW